MLSKCLRRYIAIALCQPLKKSLVIKFHKSVLGCGQFFLKVQKMSFQQFAIFGFSIATTNRRILRPTHFWLN